MDGPPQIATGFTEDDDSALAVSLCNGDVQAVLALVAGYFNAMLQKVGSQRLVTALGGDSCSLSDGVVLHQVCDAITGARGEYEEAPGNEFAEKGNLWGVLSRLEEAGVTPTIEGHYWDADAIHKGNVVSCAQLGVAILLSQGVRVPQDVYVWEAPADGGDADPTMIAITDCHHEEERLGPTLIGEVVEGGSSGQKFVVRDQPIVIGRYDANVGDVAIPDDTVSAIHCEIKFDGHHFVIKDLGSTCGVDISQPFADRYVAIGDRENPLGISMQLWRGSQIALGDTLIAVTFVEGTDAYSDYPALAEPYEINLEVSGGPVDGSTITVGAAGMKVGRVEDDGTAAAYTQIDDPEVGSAHCDIRFSSFHGCYVLTTTTYKSTRYRPGIARGQGPWVTVLPGSICFLNNGDEIMFGSNTTAVVSGVPGGAAAKAPGGEAASSSSGAPPPSGGGGGAMMGGGGAMMGGGGYYN